jgi:hypothetical protein
MRKTLVAVTVALLGASASTAFAQPTLDFTPNRVWRNAPESTSLEQRSESGTQEANKTASHPGLRAGAAVHLQPVSHWLGEVRQGAGGGIDSVGAPVAPSLAMAAESRSVSSGTAQAGGGARSTALLSRLAVLSDPPRARPRSQASAALSKAAPAGTFSNGTAPQAVSAENRM